MNKTEKLQLARTKLKQYQDRKSNPEASSPIPDDVESSLEASSLLKTDLIISLEFQLQELQNKFTLEIETKNFSITNLVNENEKLHILLQESNSRNLKLDIANKDIEASLTELRARHVEIHKEKLSLVSENQALIDSLNSSNDNGLKSGLDSDDKKELDFLRSRELTDAKERSDFIDKLNELETLSKDLKTQNEVMNALLKKREINRFGESTETSLIYNDDDPDEIIQQQLEFLTVSVKALEKDKIDLELIVSNLQQDLKSEQKISALLQAELETLPDFIELYRKERLQMLNTSHINNVKNRVQGDFNQGLQDYTRNFDHISKGTIQGVVLQGSVSEIVGGCRNCDAASFEL